VPLWGGELGLHLTQCGQGRGIPACQVSSWSVKPLGHNTPTLQTDRQERTDRQRSDSIGRTVLQTVAQNANNIGTKWQKYIKAHLNLKKIETNQKSTLGTAHVCACHCAHLSYTIGLQGKGLVFHSMLNCCTVLEVYRNVGEKCLFYLSEIPGVGKMALRRAYGWTGRWTESHNSIALSI